MAGGVPQPGFLPSGVRFYFGATKVPLAAPWLTRESVGVAILLLPLVVLAGLALRRWRAALALLPGVGVAIGLGFTGNLVVGEPTDAFVPALRTAMALQVACALAVPLVAAIQGGALRRDRGERIGVALLAPIMVASATDAAGLTYLVAGWSQGIFIGFLFGREIGMPAACPPWPLPVAAPIVLAAVAGLLVLGRRAAARRDAVLGAAIACAVLAIAGARLTHDFAWCR